MIKLMHGDCLEKMKEIEPESVDAIVTDPPAGISFMSKSWDADKGGRMEWIAWMEKIAAECIRVIKPGGHALVWAIPRTSHWTGMAWENAGWVPRDKIYHCFGSGFPKSLDISKAIDKAAGAEREVVGVDPVRHARLKNQIVGSLSTGGEWTHGARDVNITAPATPEAQQWQGWGTALKPSIEEWWLFRKPLAGTVAENVLKHGTGAINVDGCRVGTTEDLSINGNRNNVKSHWGNSDGKNKVESSPLGRYPANLIHDGSDEVVGLFPETGGKSASRFFYCAKASKKDRDDGCEALGGNKHSTVKPTSLMRYLCKLITPPGGTVLDPFMGSGSTGKAAVKEGFKFIGIEKEKEYLVIANARIAHAKKSRGLLNYREVW